MLFHLLIVSDPLEIIAGVERRRIYDIVNVLESIGVRFLNSLFFSQPVGRMGQLCLACFVIFPFRFSLGRQRISIPGKDLLKYQRLWRS